MLDNSKKIKSSSLPPSPREFTPLLSGQEESSLNKDALPSHLKTVLRVMRLAGPMSASYTFSFSLVAIILMMGRLGGEDDLENYLAAAPLITTAVQGWAFLMASPLLGMSIEAGERFGVLERLKKDESTHVSMIAAQERSVRDVYRVGVGLSALIAPVGMVGMFYTEELLNLLALDPTVTALVGQYLKTYCFALPGFLLRIASEQMLFAKGKTLPAMLFSLTNFTASTALAIWLAFGSPQLKIQGIAGGFLADAYLTAFAFVMYLAFHGEFKHLNLLNLTHWNKELFSTLKTILNLGLPITFQLGAQTAIAQAKIIFAGWLGSNALAAQAFTMQLASIAIIPNLAFGQSVSQEVSRAKGEGLFQYATRVARDGMLTSLAMIAPIIIPFTLRPEWLSALMTHHKVNPSIMKLVKTVIPLTAIGILADTVRFSSIETLRTVNQTLMPTLISIAIMGLGLLASYLLGLEFGVGLVGVELGSMVSLVLAAMVLLPLFGYLTRSSNFEVIQAQADEKRENTSLTFGSGDYSSAFFSGGFSGASDEGKVMNIIDDGRGFDMAV